MMNKGKIAIVTGGSSGIGFAIAKKFTDQKIFTYIIGRDQKKLDDACRQLNEYCAPLAFNVDELGKIPQFVQSIINEKGKIDILVNNAGVNLKKSFIDVTDDEFERIIKTNLTSVFSFSREVAKVMLPRKSGSIIHISSMAAHYGIPKVVPYTASKSAIEGITKAMAVELSPLGIRVNCVAPGFISTPMSSVALDNDPERKNRVLTRTPMGKLGLPQDVAQAVYFLTTEEAGFITGATIPVDGGNSIGF
jgi:NAD(P)-dependent dehydrogenase (short-subunit alcohol dehydrogenase family)